MNRFTKRPRKTVPLSDTAPWILYGPQRASRSATPLCPHNPSLNSKLHIYLGDITHLQIDCIVNAANSSLLGGGGVDGAIHAAAGPGLREECSKLGGCKTGEAKITAGHKLPAKHIIHTVGPRGKQPDVLKSSYNRCFEILKDKELKSIAFPCVSTGVYGYPNKAAADVSISTTREFLEQHHSEIDGVVFCLFTNEDIRAYHELLPVYFPLNPLSGEEINEASAKSLNKTKCSDSENGEEDEESSSKVPRIELKTKSEDTPVNDSGDAADSSKKSTEELAESETPECHQEEHRVEEPMSKSVDPQSQIEEPMSQAEEPQSQIEEPMSQSVDPQSQIEESISKSVKSQSQVEEPMSQSN